MNKYLALQKQVFDINKVTVVGSPTITSDGIVSGFSETSYIDAIKLLPNDKPWEAQIEYTVSQADTATTNSKNIIYNSSGDKGIILIWTAWNSKADYLDFIINEEGGTQSTVRVTSNTKFVANDKLNITIGYDGQKYYQVAYKNGVLIQQNSTISSNPVRQSDTGFLRLGARAGSVHYCLGSIDLKQFKIYVDNQLVFQPVKPTYLLERRKEGYDPSKFTIVGSPTITEDGVASGFGSGNRLNINVDFSNLDILKIKSTFKTPNADNRTQFSAVWQIKSTISIGLEVVNQQMMIIDAAEVKSAGQFTYEDDTEYEVIWEYTISNGNWVLNYKKAIDTEFTTKTGIQVDYTIAEQSTLINIGTMNNYYYFTGGSIDLPSFSITVDGKEVFTGAKENYYMLGGKKDIKPEEDKNIPLEYLESTGTQYIDTGFLSNQLYDKSIYVKMKTTGGTSSYAYNGAYHTSGTGLTIQFGLLATSDTLCRATANHFDPSYLNVTDLQKNEYTELLMTPTEYWVNGEFKANHEQTSVDKILETNNKFLIFGRSQYNNTNSITPMIISEFWIKDANGKFVQHLIPVLDKNSIPCMYDKVSGKYFYNQGSGQFIGG